MIKKLVVLFIVLATISAIPLTAYAAVSETSLILEKPGGPKASPPSGGPKNPPSPPSGGPGLGAGPSAPGTSEYRQTEVAISAEDAQDTALDAVGGGTVARAELKYPKHGAEYKIVIVGGDYKYDVKVDASSGAVRDIKTHEITKVSPSAYRSGATASVSADEAKSIAIESAGGGIVTDCKLSYKPHLGALAYHVHVANGQYEYCVELDASSGDVFKAEQKYKP